MLYLLFAPLSLFAAVFLLSDSTHQHTPRVLSGLLCFTGLILLLLAHTAEVAVCLWVLGLSLAGLWRNFILPFNRSLAAISLVALCAGYALL